MLLYLTILFILTIIAFVGIRHLMVTEKNNKKISQTESKRRDILMKVKPFLAPYYDIWKNITIRNANCSIKLIDDGTTVVISEKKKDFPRTFRIIASPIPNLWEKLCLEFNASKTYDILLKECKENHIQTEESIVGKTPEKEKVTFQKDYNKERNLDV